MPRKYEKIWHRVCQDFDNDCRTILEDTPKKEVSKIIKAVGKEKNLVEYGKYLKYKVGLELFHEYNEETQELTLYLIDRGRPGRSLRGMALRSIL